MELNEYEVLDFKITWNINAPGSNKVTFYLLFNKIKKMYSLCLASVVFLGYFIVFRNVCRSLQKQGEYILFILLKRR